MRHIFCAILICGAVQASAQGTFLVPASDKTGDVVPVKPLGKVNFMTTPMVLEGATMVASSRVQEVTTITFDTAGTAYAFFKVTGEEPRFLPISGRSMGAEGNFEYEGWPYVISQGRIMAIEDGLVASKFSRKLGDWGQRLAWNRTLPATLWSGGATITQMTLAALFDWKIVATSAGAAVLGFVGKYGYDVRHDLMKSHLELGYSMNWFTKPLLTNVERPDPDTDAYEYIEAQPSTEARIERDGRVVPGQPGVKADVLIHYRKGGVMQKVLMSELVRDQKVAYRHKNCIRLLEEIRGKGE